MASRPIENEPFQTFSVICWGLKSKKVLTLLHIAVIVTSMEITNFQEFTGSPKINYDLIWISKILRTNIKYGMTTFHIAAKLDTIEMPILLIQPLLTYFIFLHIVVIQQSVYLFKIYGHNLPTEKVRKITSVLCSWRKLRVST